MRHGSLSLLILTISLLILTWPATSAFAASSCPVAIENATLVASTGSPMDGFGQSLAVFGDTVAVGAPGDDDASDDAGAVYIYERDPAAVDSWREQFKLTSSSPAVQGRFGVSVGLNADTLAIGEVPVSGLGLVHIYQRVVGKSDEWELVQRLSAPEGEEKFGMSVSLSGDLLVIGTSDGGSQRGTAYLFERAQPPSSGWDAVSRHSNPTTPDGGNCYGCAVAVDGLTFAIGAPYDTGDVGAAWIYERVSGGG